MTFNEFVKKFNLKNKATSNIKKTSPFVFVFEWCWDIFKR